ncbi:OmpA family protein [Chitinimonas arctica]|uniref:OmpA family protein n=1 Tax=Chitinimonas arctica TaxID=2594795 RepID=A0A516SB54_9NEIS|nr:OmpA family protein [Chitinimonas arctica]QDQ25375.1 OmpA family protein [Chitinimonas arctica]
MKKSTSTPVLVAIAAMLAACGSVPTTTSLLDQTRLEFQAAQNNPQVATYAQQEIKLAGDAMAQANTAASQDDSKEKIDKLAYIAKQKIALSQEVAKRKGAEAEVASSGKARDAMRLEQRTIEADQAKLNAEQAKLVTQAAQTDTAEAQRQMQEAQARNAQLEAQLADLAAKKTERGMVITLGDVLFGTDMARLNPDGMRTAQKLADVLQQNPQRNVLVEGFTDSTGSGPHNQELSERRAGAVQSALQELGVARSRVSTRGYGETHPVADNDTAQSRQLNRRVEIVLSDASGVIPQR